jgi:hypothetical protein
MAIWLTKKWRIIGVYKWLMGFNYWLGSQSLHWTVGLLATSLSCLVFF